MIPFLFGFGVGALATWVIYAIASGLRVAIHCLRERSRLVLRCRASKPGSALIECRLYRCGPTYRWHYRTGKLVEWEVVTHSSLAEAREYLQLESLYHDFSPTFQEVHK